MPGLWVMLRVFLEGYVSQWPSVDCLWFTR